MDVRVGLWRKLSTEELMLLNCGVGEDFKGDQFWVFIGRTDAKAETPILWPPDAKGWFIWKDPDAGKDWRQEKGMTEDEMVRWHHWLDGHGFYSKRIKYLGINITWKAKDLHTENYTTLLKEIKENLNENILCLHVAKSNVVKMIKLPQTNYRFSAITAKTY